MHCPRCGLILSEGVPLACPRCGLPLATPPPPPQAPPTLPPGYGSPHAAPLYYAPPSGYGPYQPPVSPARGNKRLFLIFGVLAAVIVVGSLGALGLVLASHNGSSGAGRVHTAATTPTPTLDEQQALKDPLTANTYGWPVNDHCFFQSDGYHVKDSYGCYAPVPAYLLDSSDTSVDVKLADVSGDNGYGLFLRIQHVQGDQNNRYYAFLLSSSGEWSFQRCDGACTPILNYAANAAIHAGVGATNTLRVIAQKSHFTFFINGTQVAQADDSEYLDGQTGVAAIGTCEAVFTNMLISQIN